MLVLVLWLLGWLACSLIAVIVGSRLLNISLEPEDIGLIVVTAMIWPISAPGAVIALACVGIARLLSRNDT